MILNDVHQGITAHKGRKRVGRGIGSGHGKTAGRGHKGDYSRSGSSKRRGFSGGQMPLFRRVAKVGFSNAPFAARVAIVNLTALEKAFDNGATVGPEELRRQGLVSGQYDVIKILANGELKKKLAVTAHRFSKAAEEKITAAGGTVERIASHRETEQS